MVVERLLDCYYCYLSLLSNSDQANFLPKWKYWYQNLLMNQNFHLMVFKFNCYYYLQEQVKDQYYLLRQSHQQNWQHLQEFVCFNLKDQWAKLYQLQMQNLLFLMSYLKWYSLNWIQLMNLYLTKLYQQLYYQSYLKQSYYQKSLINLSLYYQIKMKYHQCYLFQYCQSDFNQQRCLFRQFKQKQNYLMMFHWMKIHWQDQYLQDLLWYLLKIDLYCLQWMPIKLYHLIKSSNQLMILEMQNFQLRQYQTIMTMFLLE